MKQLQILAVLLLFIGCSSDSNPEEGLPKETQTGANTFGCLIDGKLLVPRSGNNNIVILPNDQEIYVITVSHKIKTKKS